MDLSNPSRSPKHYRDEVSQDERLFWRGFNKRKHAYFQTVREEQREAFRDECAKPDPTTKPITGRILEVIR